MNIENVFAFIRNVLKNSIRESFQLPQSITGEELPYVFGAPLASVRPFLTSFSPAERLLSEEIMVYWTNFAKTG